MLKYVLPTLAVATMALGGYMVVRPALVQPPMPPPAIYSLGDIIPKAQVPDSFCYAVIGDYGDNSLGEDSVARMVKGWNPSFIVTTGDNDYEDKHPGTLNNIDTMVVKYYGSFIKANAHQDRFFPCLGNHDQDLASVESEYFALFPFLHSHPDYDFSWGPLHFYSLNSGPSRPNGFIDSNILTALKGSLLTAPETYHIVFFHHPPYAPGKYGAKELKGKFDNDKVDLVLNGHIHYYERMVDARTHINYITIGNGGRNDVTCSGDSVNGYQPTSRCTCKDGSHGALKVIVVKTRAIWQMRFEYYIVADQSAPGDVLILP